MLPKLTGWVIMAKNQQLESEKRQSSDHLCVLLAAFQLPLHPDSHSPQSKIAFLCIRPVTHSDQFFVYLQHNLLNDLAVVAQDGETVTHFFPSLPCTLLSPLG